MPTKTRNATVGVELVFEVVEQYHSLPATDSAPFEVDVVFDVLNCEIDSGRVSGELLDQLLDHPDIYKAIEQELEKQRGKEIG